MRSLPFARFAPAISAAILAIACSNARAAIDDELNLEYTATFSSMVNQVGFSFTLPGDSSYAYNLILDLNGAFSNQTGLLGYAKSIKFNGDEVTWAPLTSTGPSGETYKLGLNNVGAGSYWLTLPSLNPGQSGSIAVDLTALRVPVTNTPSPLPSAPVPEPETYAMMLAGLGTIAWIARRKRRSA